MGRRKMFNADLAEEVGALAQEFRVKEATVRAHHARLAEEEIASARQNLLDVMFVKYANSGPSEIANSTGISRSTIIRWRDEWLKSTLGEEVKPVAEEAEVEVESIIEAEVEAVEQFTFGAEMSSANYMTNWIEHGGERVYLLTGEDFAIAETIDDAEQTTSERPEWLTDDIMRQAEDATGAKIMFAPWA